jgi:regulator of nucleoside diphosphate kinase
MTMTMESTATNTTALAPRITLSADDFERLSALVQAATSSSPQVAEYLAGEIGRAHVLAAGRCPQDVVCMNSEVEFRDDSTGRVQTMTLVYPNEADISNRKLSVLTPVGAALIGVRAGEAITWETPNGDVRSLTVLSVREP